MILKRELLDKIFVSKDPEMDQAYGKARIAIDDLWGALVDKCVRALKKSEGNRNSLYELQVLLERGKSNTLKEVVTVIKELFSIRKAQLEARDFLAECGDFFGKIMESSPFLARVLISNIGLDDKEIHHIFRATIESWPNNFDIVLIKMGALLKSIPKRLNERDRKEIENQAVRLLKTLMNSADINILDNIDIREALRECLREISQEELEASLLYTYLRQARGRLNPVERRSLIEEVPVEAINHEEGRTYRAMAEALFPEPQPVQDQNPEAAEE